MAENTKQYEWIVKIKGNLDVFLPTTFVAGDLFWYPVEGDPHTRVAPDVLVAPGRPKGDRGSYMQWVEGGIPPKVVFEIWPPSIRFPGQAQKLRFYERHGVEEFYSWDPDLFVFAAFIRQNGSLELVAATGEFVSPLLGIRFVVGDDLQVFKPDGSPFLTFAELAAARVEVERQLDVATRERDAAVQRAASLLAQLRAAGITPE